MKKIPAAESFGGTMFSRLSPPPFWRSHGNTMMEVDCAEGCTAMVDAEGVTRRYLDIEKDAEMERLPGVPLKKLKGFFLREEDIMLIFEDRRWGFYQPGRHD